MKRDSLFFRYFKELPGSFFHLVGRPESDAARYDLKAIEFKETPVRLDGVFLPHQPDADPAYIWEVQHYRSDGVYANIMSKVGRFLEHGNPKQDWIAVAIYPTRALEQENLHPYRCLINSDQLIRIYQDELPPAQPDQIELGVLELIGAKPEVALEKAKAMVPRVQASKKPPQFRRLVIQFIETAILCQFPHWSRQEIEKMLQVTDVTQTRVYQEALEEGREEGMEKGMEKGREEVALNLLKIERPIKEIAAVTGLTLAQIRRLKKKLPGE